jgi:hypothetical protein
MGNGWTLYQWLIKPTDWRVISKLAIVVSNLFVMSSYALAEDVADAGMTQQLNIDGSLRGGYYGASRSLDDRKDLTTAALWLKTQPNVGPDASLQIEGWVRNDDSFAKGKSQGQLREGYLYYAAGDLDWRIGKQIIAWGRADGLNPTDNLTPRDYTLLTPEDSDQRLGTTAVKMNYHLPNATLTAIWLPTFTPSVYPIPPQSGIPASESVSWVRQAALKLDHSSSNADWSVSWFSGLDMTPDLKMNVSGVSGTTFVLQHRRIRVLGLDGATTIQRYGLRAEAAYTLTDNAANDPLVKQPFLYAIIGGDRTFGDNFNINLQYYFRRVSNFHDPQAITDLTLRTIALQQAILSNQATRFQQGITLRISDKWLDETLEGEIAGVFPIARGDFALKPKMLYAFTDQWKGTLGADIFRGSDNTFYGRLRSNSSLFAEIKYSF